MGLNFQFPCCQGNSIAFFPSFARMLPCLYVGWMFGGSELLHRCLHVKIICSYPRSSIQLSRWCFRTARCCLAIFFVWHLKIHFVCGVKPHIKQHANTSICVSWVSALGKWAWGKHLFATALMKTPIMFNTQNICIECKVKIIIFSTDIHCLFGLSPHLVAYI